MKDKRDKMTVIRNSFQEVPEMGGCIGAKRNPCRRGNHLMM